MRDPRRQAVASLATAALLIGCGPWAGLGSPSPSGLGGPVAAVADAPSSPRETELAALAGAGADPLDLSEGTGAPGSTDGTTAGSSGDRAPTGEQPLKVSGGTPAIELYATDPSVLPGQRIGIAVSSTAPTYILTIYQVLPVGLHRVWRSKPMVGRSYRARVRVDLPGGAIRTHWPTAVGVPTKGWPSGVYLIYARTSTQAFSKAWVVVRDAHFDAAKPAYVFPAITQAAYNRWGGWSYYGRPKMGTALSLQRPMDKGGLGNFGLRDLKMLRFLLGALPNLQFTTDYDLGHAPPGAEHPAALLLGSHTEYVPGPMNDWVRGHLSAGDMHVGIFGANSFYWRVRLVPSPVKGAPNEIVCFKANPGGDPLAASDPTGLFRALPAHGSEGSWLGSQYQGVITDGHSRYDETISAWTPSELLDGTGWGPGTILKGVLQGEGDGPTWTSSLMFTRLIAIGPLATDLAVEGPVGMTIGENAAGGRVFDAGTFAFDAGLAPAAVDVGVSPASYARFTLNILRWLRLSPRGT